MCTIGAWSSVIFWSDFFLLPMHTQFCELLLQEWLEENEGGSLLETLYKALDEVSRILNLKQTKETEDPCL